MQCQVDIPAVEGLQNNELTVGRVFFLRCQSGNETPWPKNIDIEKLQFVLTPEQKYQIKLLGFEFRTGDTADLKVTSYVGGPVDFKNLQVTDQTQAVDLGPVQFKVKSVLEPPKEGQAQVEAYGPMGPASIHFPLVYTVSIVLVIALLTLFIAQKVFRWSQRRRVLARLRQHDAALAPLPQFHQSWRKLRRENPVFFGKDFERTHIEGAFDQLNNFLRIFLIRELHVPALEWSDKLILADLRKYHKVVFLEAGPDLKKLLGEFTQGEKNKTTLSAQDILVLSEQTRRCVEKIDQVKASHLAKEKK